MLRYSKLFFTFLILFFISSLSAKDDISLILEDLNQKTDLSKQTLKEGIGHTSVFTRSEIDKLRLTTLKDLMKYVRFMGYTENTKSLLDPLFSTYKANYETYIRVYIDDQALYFPYQGTGMQFFGQVNLNFVDHIEIYWGVPTYSFGSGVGYTVIKLYSKKPKRENTTVAQINAKTYGSVDANFYTAYQKDDFAYLFSVNKQNLNRKQNYLNNYELNRDQDNDFVYSNLYFNKNSKITISALKSKYKTFIDEAVSMQPIDNNLNMQYLYLGYNYTSDDKSLKAYLGYANSNTKHNQSANPVNISPLTNKPYYKKNEKFKEEVLDLSLTKEFNFYDNNLEIAYKGRYKKFDFDSIEIDNIPMQDSSSYNKEYESTLYLENRYLFDEKNLLITSLKYDNFHRNGDVQNTDAKSAKIGYVYNENNWFAKAFYYYGKDPRAYYNFYNYRNYKNDLAKYETVKSYSTELGYKNRNTKVALTYGSTKIDRKVSKEPFKIDLYSLNFNYHFNSLNSIRGSYWISKYDLGKNNTQFEPENIQRDGFFLIIYNSFGKFDIANSLSYYKQDITDKDFYNVNSTLTYHHNRNLSFYVEANNIFDDSQEQNYFTLNPIETNPLTKHTVQAYDRTFGFGIEYTF